MSLSNIDESERSVKKGMRWVFALFLCAAVVLIIALVFILAQTTSNQDLYTPYFGWLSLINTGIALLLLLSLIWAAVRLIIRLRKGRFGSKLLIKLAAVFALVGIFPGVLVYAVSYQFVSKSIETWFDVKVEGALSAGLKLGQASLEAQAQDLANKTVLLTAQIAQTSNALASAQLDRIRQQLEVDSIMLLTSEGEVIGGSGPASYRLTAERLSVAQRAELLQERVIYGIEDQEDGSRPTMWAVATLPASLYDPASQTRVVRVTATLPAALATNANMVQEAYKEYQERALGREGLRQMYIGTLTLALLLAMFGAVALAVMLGQQLIRPLLILVEGVRQVGEGDLSPKELVHTQDELGGLTHAFADMTSQLREANAIASKSMRQVAHARAHLQTILDNLTTGVIELDEDDQIQMINPGAQKILRAEPSLELGKKLNAVGALEEFSKRIAECFAMLPNELNAYWQETFELNVLEEGGQITIIARGVWLSSGVKLMVIDDISDIISAQRSMAWGEVARRLAHEIKNPLTPIQLSAERIEYKLSEKLEGQDRVLLERSVKMIVDQVDAMKHLVDEFREYARLPVAELKPLNLNSVVHDILQLYIGANYQNKNLHIELELAEVSPIIKGDASQLRQVLHNLLQNAFDAVAEQEHQQVDVITEYKPQNSKEQTGRVCLWIKDNGTGFTEKTLKRAFEPYVTTKARGTGLGLAVVKKIMDEHGARIDLSNRVDKSGKIEGAQVQLSFPIIANTQALEK